VIINGVGIGNWIWLLQIVTRSIIALLLIHTFCNSLQHALSLLSLLCLHWVSPSNSSQCHRSHSFCVPRPWSLLTGVYLTRLGVATQWLTTIGAPPLPMLLPGATFSDDPQWVCLPTANCRLMALDWLVFQFSTYSLSTDTKRTLLPTIPLLLHDIGINTDHIENTRSCVLIKPFPCNGNLYWLHNPGYQWICHKILQHYKRNKTEKKSEYHTVTFTSLQWDQCMRLLQDCEGWIFKLTHSSPWAEPHYVYESTTHGN
jgi:hypothetical protein